MNNVNIKHSELLLTSIRLLIIIACFESKKNYNLNYNKLLMFDHYMKYPLTMFDKECLSENELNFDEYYSYFDISPNRDNYHKSIRYLISKAIIQRKIINNDFCYITTSRGKELFSNLQSNHALKLKEIGDIIVKVISKQSDSKISQDIISKSLMKIRASKEE